MITVATGTSIPRLPAPAEIRMLLEAGADHAIPPFPHKWEGRPRTQRVVFPAVGSPWAKRRALGLKPSHSLPHPFSV